MTMHNVVPALVFILIAAGGPIIAVALEAGPALGFLIGMPFGAVAFFAAFAVHDRLRP